MTEITGYHAHVYYDESTFDQARELCEQTGKRFDIPVGRLHQKPVGPHPCWSCQLTVNVEKFAEVMIWLSLNRDGLTVFVHPETGDHLRDHRDYAMWLGESKILNLAMFE